MDVFTQLVVDADCERVWRAWEVPEQLRGWWSPGGSVVTSASVELTPGGSFMVSSKGRGLVFEVRGTVEAAAPPRSFVTTWTWTQGDPDIAGQETRLVVLLDPDDTGTRVTVQQSGFTTRGSSPAAMPKVGIERWKGWRRTWRSRRSFRQHLREPLWAIGERVRCRGSVPVD